MTSDHGSAEKSLDELYRRPGFLLRRAHQISVALFLEETAGLGLTTTQYGTMVVLRARGSLDQVGIATLVGIDRSTTALVVSKLEEAGYIERRDDDVDKRRKIITLSLAGHAMLERVAEPAKHARARALDAFSAKDAAKFLNLLERFVDRFNEHTRAPIRPETNGKRASRK
ncbi:MarR family winged helix-turn-helix transcriptional regulator [Glacieibacterium megasporae]|uniref:MarR family winged helix-turn-helix transcriptional regulator n=1 Tax=Glacieibacterium megasporae TaxID=2835787 RepID=UPI001C1E1F76|nr:MarR family winged helix-turn-helix transcriptional regulator [Polymorphobacter megasporae]UAJ12590.1 MarR family winged helix-turn-helix transcriptional regulator [Polymorphobacter megasporae]